MPICSMSRTSLVGLTSLTILHLKVVNVNQDVLQHILSDFPVLEQLSVHGLPHLVNLKYSGPSLKLKYLSISECAGLKCIEICNINIVSFIYFGRKLILQLKNLPRLVELYVSPGYRRRLSYAFAQVSCIFSQLLSWVKPKMRRQVVETVERPHQHPKVVELAGCYGRTTDVELAIYFIQNAFALKKMIINPRNQEMDSEKEIS
ncbi:FBD domain - like 2 [Theobroma cacao]|nr:FBD domain - like 2 [Theobroma cacao]